MSDIWLPPGARQFDPDIEAAIEGSDDPAAMRKAAEELFDLGITFPRPDRVGADLQPDSALLVTATAWGTMVLKDGREPLTAIAHEPVLERMILDGNCRVEWTSVVERAYENAFLDALCPALHVRLPDFQVFCSLTTPNPAPADWKQRCMDQGFALVVGEREDGGKAWIASEPMLRYSGVVAPRERRKVGRNDKCPCGSGIKFKHCCGR